MSGKQAKTLSDTDLAALLAYATATRHPHRDRAIVLLSFKAGLRAGEIANLTWDMIIDATGEIGATIELHNIAAKNGSGRRIPMHPDLQGALQEWQWMTPCYGPVVRSERGRHMRPSSIVNWFAVAYASLGFVGCSSHSGRRTFITRAARAAHQAGGSLRDVQVLAGHRSIAMTQRYIDGDTDAQRRLVGLI